MDSRPISPVSYTHLDVYKRQVQEQLLSNQLLERKQENLSAQKHMKGGATC